MMIHNDVLRRLRYAFNLTNEQMLDVFKLVDYEIPVEHLLNLLKKEEDAGFILCRDSVLCLFLDGWIISRRGRQEGEHKYGLLVGETLSNNDILRKIRIALELKDEDMTAILELADLNVSKSELSALFRKRGHRNYKECGDQFLRNFLVGVTRRYREGKSV
jgi:uncharacterized protein YehS (DUF1456 family)